MTKVLRFWSFPDQQRDEITLVATRKRTGATVPFGQDQETTVASDHTEIIVSFV
jgi:hypothetical protein